MVSISMTSIWTWVLIPLSPHPPKISHFVIQSSNIKFIYFPRNMTFLKCQIYFEPHCSLLNSADYNLFNWALWKNCWGGMWSWNEKDAFKLFWPLLSEIFSNLHGKNTVMMIILINRIQHNCRKPLCLHFKLSGKCKKMQFNWI